ncbi:SirB2 family protein [Paraneptunicella aestuarii]|uniref:SirB2 family protein n=1 Tax=Paraneptunicella aestuarii TaxID=2831148 RepID=UPI001E30DB1F|nr:SirB2 family protein [Paraneptunicella aestuarii]UAA40188.1 SirB2 family protein [Paraneptunicella aestuarii]
MYFFVKHLHMSAVAISLSLFILRFYWLNRDPEKLQRKWVKVAPHIVDTILLLSALTLCFIIQQYPFVDAWLTEKVIGLVFYILMGLYALKLGRNMLMRWLGFLGAIAWLVFIAKVAVLKHPILFG